MRNRALALAARPIPYIKELREIAGSVTASILMQQLDHWFSSYPEGFYKFLEPCENAAYKQGESWIEELGFSKEEFRNAFDKIGIRYESKRAYESAENAFTQSGEGTAQEHYYASYHDKIRGLTFYFRNHALLDTRLDELLAQKPQKTNIKQRKTGSSVNRETQSTVNPESQSTEIGKPNLRKSGNPTYVDWETQHTEIGKPNLDNKEYSEKTTEKTTERGTRALSLAETSTLETTPFDTVMPSTPAEREDELLFHLIHEGCNLPPRLDRKIERRICDCVTNLQLGRHSISDVQAFIAHWRATKNLALTPERITSDIGEWKRLNASKLKVQLPPRPDVSGLSTTESKKVMLAWWQECEQAKQQGVLTC